MTAVLGVLDDRFLVGPADSFFLPGFVGGAVTDPFPPLLPAVVPIVPAPDVVLGGVQALTLTAQLAPQPGTPAPTLVNLQFAFPVPTDVGLTFTDPFFPVRFGGDFLFF